MKILTIVTSTDRYTNGKLKTGLWLSEITHIYDLAVKRGFDITIASPHGGETPVDPESLRPLMLDKISKRYWEDQSFREQLRNTESLDEIIPEQFDCIYLAGGHGTMFDFPENNTLQHIIAKHFESGKIIAAICHGVCGLLNVRLSDHNNILKDRNITGFSWFEEILARRNNDVPFNLESALKERGSYYKKAFLPMTSKVMVDGNLITGQNPFSSKDTAKVVCDRLSKR